MSELGKQFLRPVKGKKSRQKSLSSLQSESKELVPRRRQTTGKSQRARLPAHEFPLHKRRNEEMRCIEVCVSKEVGGLT